MHALYIAYTSANGNLQLTLLQWNSMIRNGLVKQIGPKSQPGRANIRIRLLNLINTARFTFPSNAGIYSIGVSEDPKISYYANTTVCI